MDNGSAIGGRAGRSGDPLRWGIETVALEVDALVALQTALRDTSLGDAFCRAVDIIRRAKGHVVLGGMGKSGLIARKIAATFASSGTPAMTIHPADAAHGDLGMITADNVVVLLSWSGETVELSAVVSYCRRFQIPLIAITSSPGSTLSEQSDVALILPHVVEACPHQLAPTSSTTMQIAAGDALAVALIRERGFSADDFKVFHPGGMLSARLLKVDGIMSTGDAIPSVGPDATLLDATLEMSRKRFGVTAVTTSAGRLIGAFTDGDLRRSIGEGALHGRVADFMSAAPRFVPPTMLASEAVALMNRFEIMQLFVCDAEQLIGIVHLHDALRAGVA